MSDLDHYLSEQCKEKDALIEKLKEKIKMMEGDASEALRLADDCDCNVGPGIRSYLLDLLELK